METYEVYFLIFKVIQVLFVFAFGACVGSLINVLVYRLPLGISVVTPPSRCPSCNTKLAWKDNIPVFGWIFLGGKCRYCRTKISPEYPLVEAFTALVFVAFFALWFLVPDRAVWLGIDWGSAKPEWARNGIREVWPTFIVFLVLVSSLIAMTLTDAKTMMIPLVLTWVPPIVAVVFHPAHAALVEFTKVLGTGGKLYYTAPGEVWAMATPGPRGWPWIGASIGGAIGLVISNVLLANGLIRRSFEDYEEWEKKALAEQAAASGSPLAVEPRPEATGVPPAGGVAVADEAPEAKVSEPATASVAGVPTTAEAPPVAAPAAGQVPADMWIAYPHARREMFKELVFLAPCVTLAMAGMAIARWAGGPWTWDPGLFQKVPQHLAPLWLVVLSAVLMGYLIGGGVVWLARIAGSFGFGKEAVGLGDVHLLAAVGACLGWIDAVLAFFGAAFVGLFVHIVRALAGGGSRRTMAFGPSLAIATVLVVLLKPLIEKGLTLITHADVPINIP